MWLNCAFYDYIKNMISWCFFSCPLFNRHPLNNTEVKINNEKWHHVCPEKNLISSPGGCNDKKWITILFFLVCFVEIFQSTMTRQVTNSVSAEICVTASITKSPLSRAERSGPTQSACEGSLLPLLLINTVCTTTTPRRHRFPEKKTGRGAGRTCGGSGGRRGKKKRKKKMRISREGELPVESITSPGWDGDIKVESVSIYQEHFSTAQQKHFYGTERP